VSDWEDDLRQVIALNKSVRPADAEERLSRVIQECPLPDLQAHDAQIVAALHSFLPKRRRILEDLLKQRRESKPPSERASQLAPPPTKKPAGPQIKTPQAKIQVEDPAKTQTHVGPGAPASLTAPASALPTGAQPEPDKVARALEEIARLNSRVLPADAETKYRTLLKSLEPAAVLSHEAGLRQALEDFLPKRRRGLTGLLAARLSESRIDRGPDSESAAATAAPAASDPREVSTARAPGHDTQPGAGSTAPPTPQTRPVGSPLAYMDKRFSADLDDLSNHHVFQWATFYRDTLSEYFDSFLEYLYSADRPKLLLNLVKSALSHHAREIYGKDYANVTASDSPDAQQAVIKSMTALQRFLDLPLEFYSARLADAHHNGASVRLRQLCSAMVFGILHGFASAAFGQTGSELLPQNPRFWAHVLPFLTSEDLRELATVLQPDDFVEGFQDSVLPLVQALDMFLAKDAQSAPLPALSQYVLGTRRLDISLQMPPNAVGSRLIELQCYLSAQYVDRHLIEEAAARAVSAVVAPLRPDLRGLVASIERLSDIVVPTGGSGREVAPHARLLAVMEDLVYETKATSLDRPISYNYAAEFPLENPFLTKYNHVYRISVRRLMQSYERRNGVRLWCSVRRSGKTTACASDLGSTTGQSAIIAQTCDSTGQMPGGDLFYKSIRQALESGQRLDDEFVARTIAGCLPRSTTGDTRVVLVLDEYETLFGDLKTSLMASPELRYAVVQPLLNQLVAFTRDNLLILMGQQPNAHFILMDQNQLSPVVEQDSFPLFAHEPASASTGEFYELLHKVMTRYVELDLGFVSRVYEETGGHPFLTVKLLVSFMDWLIAVRRPVSSLSPVRAELFSEFAEAGLSQTAILHNFRYDLFKAAASSHLSPVGRATDPWLHSVYSALRGLALFSPASLSLSLDDYVAMVSRDCAGTSPEELLSTATMANFLTFDGAVVRPRIPLLARIASAVTPL
jgi:hypothetical protein